MSVPQNADEWLRALGIDWNPDGEEIATPGANVGAPVQSDGSENWGQTERVLYDLRIFPENAQIQPGTPLNFTVTADYSDGTNELFTNKVVWKSSDPAIAIDNRGSATARPVTATATITATDPQTGISAQTSASVADPKPGPSLRRIDLEPATFSLKAVIDFGQEPPVQKLKATGVYEDQSTQTLTTRLQWSSSDDEIAHVDQEGKVTPGHKAGTASIVATDRTSAALGAAIAGQAKVTVTVPTAKNIVIKPAETKIAGGENRNFTATVVFTDDSKLEFGGGKGVITWASSSDIVYFTDDNGSARIGAAGTAKISATHKGNGATGELNVTVEWERSVETPFGKFSYIPNTEKIVLPLLTKTTTAFTTAENLDTALDEKFIELGKFADAIRPIPEVEAEVRKNTDRTLKIEATAARAAEKDLETLKSMLERLREDAGFAAENLTITDDDLKGASDTARANALMKQAQEHQAGVQGFIKVVSIGLDTGFKLAKSDPAVLKPAWDAAGLILQQFGGDNPWLEEAQKLQAEAQEISLNNAAKKFDLAGRYLKSLKKQLQELEPKLAAFRAEDDEGWKTAEGNFDKDTKGSFRFDELKKAEALAEQTVVHARRTTETAFAAKDAARALARPGEPPSSWLAKPAEGMKVVRAFYDGAVAIFDGAIPKRQTAENLLQRFQQTRVAARKAMRTSA